MALLTDKATAKMKNICRYADYVAEVSRANEEDQDIPRQQQLETQLSNCQQTTNFRHRTLQSLRFGGIWFKKFLFSTEKNFFPTFLKGTEDRNNSPLDQYSIPPPNSGWPPW
jgi:hypothetical protein